MSARFQLPALPGIVAASCAIAFFRSRHRWQRRRLKRRATRCHLRRDLTHYRESVALSRGYVRQARREGWRGSFRAAVLEAAAMQEVSS